MTDPMLSPRAFKRIAGLFERETGIQLGTRKHSLVMSRLVSRLRTLHLASFDAYCELIEQPLHAEERQLLIDRLTTNETYFFREHEHFTFLRNLLSADRNGTERKLWSAACSSGEEVYSLAMLMLDLRPNEPFVVRGSDISQHVLDRALRAVYPIARLEHLPQGYLKRFFLRGQGDYAQTVRIDGAVRTHVEFFRHNLMLTDASLGTYDVIFLRNALIYFSNANKQAILERVAARLKPRGLLFIGLSESLHGHTLPLESVGRSIFQRVSATSGRASAWPSLRPVRAKKV